MIELIYASLKKYSNNNAFYINNTYYSYEDLSIKIASIRKEIQRFTEIKNPIGIVAIDDIETYSAIIAVLFSGMGYVIINPNNPLERNQKIISESGLSLLLSSNLDYANLLLGDIDNINAIDLISLLLQSDQQEIINVQEEDFSYLLFTSGSTGIPKGVPISRKNLNSFYDSFISIGFKINEKDRFLQMFDLTFDVSVAATLIPLTFGACVYTIPSNEFKYPKIYKLLKEENISFVTIVPSLLTYFKPYFNELLFNDVKYCIMTAEASHNELIEAWSRCIPNAEIYNLYGPTEATVWCFEYRWDKSNFHKKGFNGSASIGKPMKNVNAILIDDHNKIIAGANEKGELCLSGTHLTKGYWNNKELDLLAFININIQYQEVRFYKTGDICYRDSEGDYMYCGRIDHQVQIQGHRVELSEIELPVRKHFNITNLLALPVENKVGITEIVLFVEKFSGKKSDINDLLISKIPSYMLPKEIINLDSFPLNSSNKIDRKALLKLIVNNE